MNLLQFIVQRLASFSNLSLLREGLYKANKAAAPPKSAAAPNEPVWRGAALPLAAALELAPAPPLAAALAILLTAVGTAVGAGIPLVYGTAVPDEAPGKLAEVLVVLGGAVLLDPGFRTLHKTLALSYCT